ncbi:MAG: hypothetical protein ACRC46_08575 [Thermoguttaceae bacterium]
MKKLSLLALSLVLAFGCGPKLPDGMPPIFPCVVVLTQDGKPLTDANVVLHPADNSNWNGVGSTDASGRARIFTSDKYEGAIAGKFKVTIRKIETEMPKPVSSSVAAVTPPAAVKSYSLVDTKLGDKDTTSLEIEVKKGTKDYPLDAGKAARELVPDR